MPSSSLSSPSPLTPSLSLSCSPSQSPSSPSLLPHPSSPTSSSSSLLSPSCLLLHLLLLLLLLPHTHSTYFRPLCNATDAQLCTAPTSQPWTRRSEAFLFHWYGAMFISGGLNTIAPNGPLSAVTNTLYDTWGSYDLGRTWRQATAVLSTACTSTTSQATVYSGYVFLVCDSDYLSDHVTFYTDSPTVSYWYTLYDGLNYRIGFSINRMAVPFDGIGTLVLLGGNAYVDNNGDVNDVNDVWTLSTSGAFNTSEAPWQFHQFQNPMQGGTYYAPWLLRTEHSTTTDAEGLVLIFMGGNYQPPTACTEECIDPVMNDVWQMSWVNGATNPLWYELTATAPWKARKLAVLFTVNDWLFLYGGSTEDGDFGNGNAVDSLDDVWQSSDYGSNWVEVSTMGTGSTRHGNDPIVVGRRFYIIGGSQGDEAQAIATPPTAYFNDVWVAYW